VSRGVDEERISNPIKTDEKEAEAEASPDQGRIAKAMIARGRAVQQQHQCAISEEQEGKQPERLEGQRPGGPKRRGDPKAAHAARPLQRNRKPLRKCE
jgi:hypothetical protein